MKKVALAFVLLLVALYVATVIVVPPRVDRVRTRVLGANIPVSPRAQALHARLIIADLHADALIWERDLLARNQRKYAGWPSLTWTKVPRQVAVTLPSLR